MKKLVKNVVTKNWVFTIHYQDGRIEERTIEAESKDAAFLLLQSELWDESVEKTSYVGETII